MTIKIYLCDVVPGDQGDEVPVPAVPAVSPASPGDHPVPAGVSAEAACPHGGGGGFAVPHRARHGLAGMGELRI